MRYICLSILLFSFCQLYSQNGNYFLSHYSPGKERFSNVCFDMVQDDHGVMYFATRRGILEFDGRNWDLISNNGAVYSLQLDDRKEIYWSGSSGYGKIDTNIPGSHKLKTLSSEGITDVFQNIVVHDKLYFVTEQALYIETQSQSAITIKASSITGSFGNIFELFGSVYINTQHEGIFKVEGDKLVNTTLGLPAGSEVTFSSGFNNFYILGLASNKIILMGEDLRPRELKLQDQAYADASVVVNGSWVNRDLFVLGTLRGGMIFVQSGSGHTQEIVNYNTGLPDNEVYSLMRDKSLCIWAAHEYGFTRVAPYLPFRSFSHYDGLSGNLLCAMSFQGSQYVGTSLGLFKLEREDIYEEITYTVEAGTNNRQSVPSKQIPSSSDNKKEDASTKEPKKKGLLYFFRRKRDAAKEEETNSTTASSKGNTKTSSATSKLKPRFVKKTERVLRSSQYIYKKIQGIDAKVTQLLQLDGKLIAVGLAGAFEINGLKAKAIVEEPILTAYASLRLHALLLSTYDSEVRAFQSTGDTWESLHFLENVDDRIDAMIDGVGEELWLCALDKAYRLDIAGGEVKNIQTLTIDNPTFNNITCIHWKNEILLANDQGFQRFDRKKNLFERVDSLPKPVHYFSDGVNILYNDRHTWNLLGKEKGQNNLQLLNLFQNLRFITIDQSNQDLWVITEDNELYKFYGEKFIPYEAGNQPLLRAVRHNDAKVDLVNFEVEENKSALTFEVIQPDYLASQAIEYRYRLTGLDKDWSDWSAMNNVVNYPYLPSDDYQLMVQSRDIFGKIHELPAVVFEVLPPYWQRPWFYGLEIIVFSGFVILSFRLSNRFRIISRVLSLLTIIMLIQFIQTVASELLETKASPVTDFFIQVVIAFLILPIEGYLRNFMFRSADSSPTRLHRLLEPKSGNSAGKEEEQS
ncbi:MAG TPA: triple tyrosine motif-containing protein [Ohtaekwangia sp.]|uniref:triple tyrosine motif-containing protein n=1 Tax=Ohtaekwangia sp. TaxID=2066019 RepID=UPI002F94698B